MMGWLERQREMKLDILESLARSQRAMARIIESAADAGAEGGEPAVQESLHKSIEAIAQYQLAIMEKMVGIRIGEVNVSPPSRPWTNKDLRVAACYGTSDGKQDESTPA